MCLYVPLRSNSECHFCDANMLESLPVQLHDFHLIATAGYWVRRLVKVKLNKVKLKAPKVCLWHAIPQVLRIRIPDFMIENKINNNQWSCVVSLNFQLRSHKRALISVQCCVVFRVWVLVRYLILCEGNETPSGSQVRFERQLSSHLSSSGCRSSEVAFPRFSCLCQTVGLKGPNPACNFHLDSNLTHIFLSLKKKEAIIKSDPTPPPQTVHKHSSLHVFWTLLYQLHLADISQLILSCAAMAGSDSADVFLPATRVPFHTTTPV